jgi:hypothetical protein
VIKCPSISLKKSLGTHLTSESHQSALTIGWFTRAEMPDAVSHHIFAFEIREDITKGSS